MQVSDVPQEPVIGDEVIDDGLASVVLVEPRDDIALICGRMDSAPTLAVIIHARRGNRTLSTELGMRRLQRHAEDSGRIVAIATRSGSLTARARQARVPVASRPDRVRWDAGGHKVLQLGWGRSLVLPSFGGAAPFIALAAVLFVIGALALTLAPSVELVVTPPSERLQKVVTVTASRDRTSIDTAQLLVPARDVSSSQTITLAVPTTGKALVPVQPAKAAVTLANNGTREVRVPARAILLGPGVNFELDQETVVAAGKTAPATATALQLGPAGNVAGGTIKAWQDPALQEVAVVNEGAASGGAVEERQAVDANDFVALNALAAGLEKSASLQAKILAGRPKDAVFLNTAKTTIEPQAASAAAGKPADFVLMDVTVTVTAQAVTSETLQTLARSVLLQGREGGEILTDTITAVETGARQVNSDDGSVRTELVISGQYAGALSREDLREAVKGKTADDARSTLRQRYGIQDAEVRLSPGWAPWLPRFGFRIDVTYRGTGAPSADEKAQSQPANATPSPTASASPRP